MRQTHSFDRIKKSSKLLPKPKKWLWGVLGQKTLIEPDFNIPGSTKSQPKFLTVTKSEFDKAKKDFDGFFKRQGEI